MLNRVAQAMLISAAAVALTACGERGSETDAGKGKASSALTAATLGEQSILSASDYLTQDAYASADMSRGEALSMQCRACHTLENGGASIVGPNLYGIFGKKAGTNAEYVYSEVLKTSNFVWTPRALDAWLAEPFSFLPGNRMTCPGLPNESDRNALISYLIRQIEDEYYHW